jgi:hypothetical protein
MSTTINLESKNEIVGFLKTLGTASSFVSMDTETEVKMRKTNNPFLGAVKRCKRSGLINVNFVNSVRRKLAEIQGTTFAETEYVAGSTWYKHLETQEKKPLALCVHQKDERKFYVQFFPLHSSEHRYFLDGREMSADEVKQMKSFITETERVEYKPIVITLAIDSIRKMRARSITVLNETVNRIAQRYNSPAQKRVPVAA